MERTAPLGRLTWQVGEVVAVRTDTYRARSLTLAVPGWSGHRPGQHLDLRLTAEDGYQAVRSYSIASAPEPDRTTITVELLDDGEVSPYLVAEVREGDRVELRGPIGGYFVWDGNDDQLLLLVGGGSGIVPLMSIIRHRARLGSAVPTRLLYSSRAPDDVIYRSELEALDAADLSLQVIHTFTRVQPTGWSGYRRRIDREMLGEVAWPAERQARAYICGPTRLVETVANSLIDLGYPASEVRTERFGPSGG
jgi:ferredoxin-NADP reductase